MFNGLVQACFKFCVVGLLGNDRTRSQPLPVGRANYSEIFLSKGDAMKQSQFWQTLACALTISVTIELFADSGCGY